MKINDLDPQKMLRTINEIKNQNMYLMQSIKKLNDKHNFEKDKNNIMAILGNIINISKQDFSQLEDFFKQLEQERIDEKYLEKIASVNKPSKESIKYGQELIDIRTAFMNMGVKIAARKKETKNDNA